MLCKTWGILGLLLGSQQVNCSAVVASRTLLERGSIIDEEETIWISSNSIQVKEGLARHTSSPFQVEHVGMARAVSSQHTCQLLAHYSYPNDSPIRLILTTD